jgi:hypothetical protein
VLIAESQADGTVCFRLPNTVRAYGRAMLRLLGQDQEFAGRHRRWRDAQQAKAKGDEGNFAV